MSVGIDHVELLVDTKTAGINIMTFLVMKHMLQGMRLILLFIVFSPVQLIYGSCFRSSMSVTFFLEKNVKK